MITFKLQQIIDTDKNGKELKDKDGNLIYYRNDNVALLQLLNAIDSKVVAINEYKAWITLGDKVKSSWLQDKNEIELDISEVSFLKKILENPANDRISFSLFHVRTIQNILEQMK